MNLVYTNRIKSIKYFVLIGLLSDVHSNFCIYMWNIYIYININNAYVLYALFLCISGVKCGLSNAFVGSGAATVSSEKNPMTNFNPISLVSKLGGSPQGLLPPLTTTQARKYYVYIPYAYHRPLRWGGVALAIYCWAVMLYLNLSLFVSWLFYLCLFGWSALIV
jgi:hypothetical protein